MPPGMHSNMDATGKQQDVSRCEEDERTMSLLKDQAAELKSLYRTTREDEEVVFERSTSTGGTTNHGDEDDDIHRTISNTSNATSTSSTSEMNEWSFIESTSGVRDEKKEAEEETAATTTTATTMTSRQVEGDDNKKLERTIKHVNPESLITSSPTQQAATTSSKSSPSSQSSGSPPPLVSPDQQQQLQALAKMKESQHKVAATDQSNEATTPKQQENVAKAPAKAPPNYAGTDLAAEEKALRHHPSPARHTPINQLEEGAALSPKRSNAKPPPQPRIDQDSASSPNPKMAAAVSSPTRHKMDINHQDHFKIVASPFGEAISSKAASSPNKRPSLAATTTNTMGLTRQGGTHNLNQHGLSRQGGMHDLKPPQLPVQDSVPGFQSMHPHQQQHPQHQHHQRPYSGMRRPVGGGSIASSDAQSRGPSIGGRHHLPAVRHNGIRARMPRGLSRRPGQPVDEETKQLAATLNKKRMKQKLQTQQQPRLSFQQQLQLEMGTKIRENENDLDLSDVDDDGKLCPVAAKVAAKALFNTQRRISDVSLDMESVGTGCARRRTSIRDVHKDPVFNTIVSEPQDSIPPRSTLAVQKREQQLALARKGLNRNYSNQVMQKTATFQQQSHRTGLSSLTNDSAAVQDAVVKMQERPGLVITLDHANSTHSSVGWNSASNRTLDVTAHLNATGPDTTEVPNNNYHNYHSQLQPHLEGGSVSTANRTRAALDATSVVSPPSRDEFHRRRASVRVPPDSASVASSRVSGVAAQRRRSRTSFTNGAGLRHGRPSIGGANESVRRTSKPGEVGTPRTGMDAARYHIARQIKQESEKKTIEDWDDMLKFQDDVIIELACKLSKLDNEKQVQEQQQLHLHVQKDPTTTAPSSSGARVDMIGNGPGLESGLTQNNHSYPDDLRGFVDQNSQSPTGMSRAAPENESMQTAEYQAMLIALEQSQKDSHPKTELERENDKALEIALETSLIEAQESDKRRNARQLYSDLGESLPETEPEKSAPWAPMEANAVQPSDAEVERTMEVAKRLSIETHEFEVSKKHAPSQKNMQVESRQNPPSRTGRNTLDSALEYSVSTQNEGISRSPSNVGNGANRHESTPSHSLVMPSELLEDDESVHHGTLTSGAPMVGGGVDDGDEALSLAMALSKMDVVPGNPNVLSEEESLAYALAESRRAPGAHGSMGSSDSHQRQPTQQPQSSAGSFQDHFNSQDVYQETRTPQHQFPHVAPFYHNGYHQPPQQFYPPQQFHPQMYPPQPYYPPPYQPPMYQPPPYQMPPYQPHLYPPQAYQMQAYPQFYHPPYQQPYNLPYQQPHSESQNVRTNPSASAGYFDSSPAANSPRNLAASEDDEALRLALALSREDAREANNRKRETVSSTGGSSMSLIAADDDGSLALALELSRNDAFR